MSSAVLATKLYIPPTRPQLVQRSQLVERLQEGLHRKLTLVSAPAGSGKTTLVSQWVAGCEQPVAWLSLDEADRDPSRFLLHLIAALQTILPDLGEDLTGPLQSPQPPSPESILSALLNKMVSSPAPFVLVLDDYHLVITDSVDEVLRFLLEQLPPGVHLVIVTREDPALPLARLRAREQLTELRAVDLCFSPDEAANFLNGVMGLDLSEAQVDALESRTEGWIAGLQLAAVSMRGHEDVAGFIESFTGTHRFVLDFLVEEVLGQQPEHIQTFLLNTSILDRLCDPLCETLLPDALDGSGQKTLEYLERANLFIVPLDNQRRWYRYHHLFADLLRARLRRADPTGRRVAKLHGLASHWYEENGLEVEAFQHAAAAGDIERAERLIAGRGMPLHFRGEMVPVTNWLESLPSSVLERRPSLQVLYATALTMAGHPISGIEQKLQAAEAALVRLEPDDTRDLLGQIAAIRAMLAIPHGQIEDMLVQSQRALELLPPENLPLRTNAAWTLGLAHQLRGDRAAAVTAYLDVLSIATESGNVMSVLAAATGLGQVYASENLLEQAADNYQRVLELAGDPPLPAACEASLGLAQIHYEWNGLDQAERYGQLGLELARQLQTVDTPAACEVLLARLKLARGDVASASALLTSAAAFMRQRGILDRMPDVAAAQARIFIQQGDLATATSLAEVHDLPLSRARIHLAEGDVDSALVELEAFWKQAKARDAPDERLKAAVLAAVAFHVQGNLDSALERLSEAQTLAEPGQFIRIFIDEGPPMARLLRDAQVRGLRPQYTRQLLTAFSSAGPEHASESSSASPLMEPLSEREVEVLEHIAQGLTNREIAERLYLSLHTIKTHARNIYSKLDVSNRTEAVAVARELGVLSRS